MNKFNCGLCSKDFNGALALSTHCYEYHNARFHCHFCLNQFHKEEDVTLHCQVLHVGKANFSCIWCSLATTKKRPLLDHQRKEHANEMVTLRCKVCQSLFPSFECLNNHCRRTGHRQTPPQQGAVQGGRNRLQHTRAPSMHLASPPSVKMITFRCQLCPQTYWDRRDHCFHMLDVHRSFVLCSYCEKQFDSFASLDSHVLRAHKDARSWTCVYCWISFNDITLLKAHQTLAQHDVISCPECKSLMPSRDCLVAHRDYEQNVVKKQSSIGGNSTALATMSSFLCLVCYERVPAASFLNHATEHLKTGRTPMSCNECFKILENVDSVNRHMTCFENEATRNAVGNLVCSFCGYQAEDTKKHNRHVGWCHKMLKCNRCGEPSTGYVMQKLHTAEVHRLPMNRNDSLNAIKSDDDDAVTRYSQNEWPKKKSPMVEKPSPNVAKPARLSGQQTSTKFNQSSANEAFESAKEPLRREPHQNEVTSTPKTSKNKPEVVVQKLPTPAKRQIKEEDMSSSSEDATSSSGEEVVSRKRTTPIQKEEEPPKKAKKTEEKPSPLEPPTKESKPKERLQILAKRIGELKQDFDIESTSSSSSDDSNDDDDDDDDLVTFAEDKRRGRTRSVSECDAVNISDGTPASVESLKRFIENKRRNEASNTPPTNAPKVVSFAKMPLTTDVSLFGIPAVDGQQRSRAKSISGNPPPTESNVEFVCTLCGQASIYKASMKRHICLVHKVSPDIVSDFCHERERVPPFNFEKEQKKPSAEPTKESRTVGCQTRKKGCRDCDKKEKKLKKLKKFFKEFTKATSKISSTLGEDKD